MKKLLLFPAILALGISAQKATAEEPTRQEIMIRESTIPAGPVRPRHEIPQGPLAGAWVDYTTQSVEVVVGADLGEVDITLEDRTGGTVECQTIDTEFFPTASLALPESGEYRIVISGNEYRADGDFSVR